MTSPEFPRLTQKPPFSIDDVRNAIPKQCFQRDLQRSISYVIVDFAIIFGLYVIAWAYYDYFWSFFPGVFLFPLWWFAQGTMFWALFVVGHDCGHGSFSDSQEWNYFFGHITHTFILVPFHSWRLTHHKHHLNTGNVTKDESFVALPKKIYERMWFVVWLLRYHLFSIGWNPYLIGGLPLGEYSHYNPQSKYFSDKEAPLVATSLQWMATWALVVLLPISYAYGLMLMTMYYFIPVLVFGAWIGLVTLLHHTHPDIPWYREPDWTFFKGALSTIDRNYGFVEPIHHNIGTHMVHHLFMSIPHYNLLEATEAVKPVLGQYYKKSELSIWESIKLTWANCHYVDDDATACFYQKSPSFPMREN